MDANANLKDAPVTVDSVLLTGINRTKHDYVNPAIADIYKASNLDELMNGVFLAKNKLEELGCFSSVIASIDGNPATADGLIVLFEVEEVSRRSTRFNTFHGANETSFGAGLKFPNAFGRGEQLTGDYICTLGTYKKNQTYLFEFMKPLPYMRFEGATLKTAAYKNNVPNQFLGYTISSLGGALRLSYFLLENLSQSVEWDGSWREIRPNCPSVPFGVRKELGNSFKSVLRLTSMYDSRDCPVLPHTGILARVTNEIAGLGGDTKFFKCETEVQANFPSLYDICFQLGFKSGFLKPLSSNPLSWSLADSFFLGGPHTLRGFEMNSLGIAGRKNLEMFGGLAYWTTGLHIFTNIPFVKHSFADSFRTHLFFNMGNLSQSSELTRENLGRLVKNCRMTVGFGLCIRMMGNLGVELNYCYPFRFFYGDRTVKGFQFGFGINFI